MKTIKIEIKWAMIFIIVALAWMVLERLVGLHDTYIYLHPYLTNIWMIPATLICIWALKDKKRNYYNGKISYKQALLSGFIITLIVVAFNPLSQWIISELITPNFFKNAIAYTVEHKTMTLTEAENYFNYKNYVIQGCIGGLIMGTLTYAIIAIFIRTKNK